MDGVSIAASLVGLGTAGCQIAIKLYTLASQISTASQRVSSVSNDISLTSGVLKELGELITRETANGGTSIFSQSGLETTQNSAAICESIFNEIERAAKEASEQLRTRDRIVGKIKLSISEKAKWPFLQPSIENLRIDLREAKGTLMLMLQVTNLALSQRMATIHQTTTTSIVEQREIYRAILAIQKQSQGNSSSQAEQLSMDCSSDGTLRAVSPPSPPSHTDPRETISPGEETTLASTSLAGPAAALSSSPHVMAMPGLDMPDPFVLQTSKQEATNKNQSSRSIDSIGETRHDGMSSNSNQSSPGGNNTPKLNATVDNYREQRKVLEYFVIKPSIKDDTSQPGAISLTFWNNKIPMQQVDIRKQLFSSKEEDLQHVLDAYLELFDHEREVISYLIEDTKSHVSLMLLKRTYADMTYRGILFKGVPELQFILERVMDEDKEWIREARARTAITNMNEQMHGVASSKPTYLKVNRKHVSPETLDAYDLPWEWDDHDSTYIVIRRWVNEVDQDKLFEHTRKLREPRLSSELVELRKDNAKLKLVRDKNPRRSRRRISRSWIFGDAPSPMSSIPGKPVDQDKGGEGATSGLEAGVRRHDHERSSDILEKNDIMARAGAACSIVNASPPRSQGRSHGHSMGFGDDSSDERPRSPHSYHDRSSHRSKDRSRHRSLSRSFERRRPQFHPQDNDSRLPSPYQDEMMQRLKKLEQLERKEDVVEPEELLGEGKHPPRLIEENQDPIIIKDAVSRRLLLPFHLCKSLQGVSRLLTEAFRHIETIGPHVEEGHYDLTNSRGEIILPSAWEALIEPGAEIAMHMWPMPDLTPDPVLEEINSPTPLKAKKASSDGDDESYQARGRSDSRDVIHITRYNEFDSDESNESSIVSDDAMNDEEAEKVVKELLGKYTTLGAVVGELSVSG